VIASLHRLGTAWTRPPSGRRRRRALRRAVHAAFHRVGYDLVRHSPTTRSRILAERRVTLVVDVGANEGQWANALRTSGYRGRIVSLEPLAVPFATLAARAAGDPGWTALRAALAAHDGTGEMHVTADTRMSSMLRPSDDEASWRIVGSETVATHALDSLWTTIAQPDDRVFLKIDVQGLELSVLLGAEASLPRTEGIELELSLAPVYAEAALAPTVIGHLYDRGYRLVWLERAYVEPTTGYLAQVDGIFVRVDAPR
jgi:FkbM family methyltransferase